MRTASAQNKVTLQDPETLHELACSGASESDSPWHIGNLYDCESWSMFIPYHLWTGAEWDGNKDGPCMHEASTTFFVNRRSKTTIEGPKEWRGQEIWVRAKSDGSKSQYFECHDRGIGRVYENRKGRKRVYRKTGRCKFPAGSRLANVQETILSHVPPLSSTRWRLTVVANSSLLSSNGGTRREVVAMCSTLGIVTSRTWVRRMLGGSGENWLSL